METINKNTCHYYKGAITCSLLNIKKCERCRFKKTTEKYQSDRLKYRDKEIAYLERHGIKYKKDNI